MKRHFFYCLTAVVSLLLSVVTSDRALAEQPNIILVMADDVGIEGLGCYGGTSYQTPQLDRMAAEGIRFTHAYAQPLCTPTRVQLMTGKYNHRNWRSFGILDPNEKTFGHLFSEAGYATGIFGKWQLQSYDPPSVPNAEKRRGTGMHPKDAGFDEYALYHALHTEDKGSRYANPTMLEGKSGDGGVLKTYDGRYGEDIWLEKIFSFFDRHPDQAKFVYYPMALPHGPFEPTPDSKEWNPKNTRASNLKYQKDMIEYMDTVVGRLLKGLDQRNLRDDTIVIFYSDNGTYLDITSAMRDGRQIQGGKSTSQQTGIHVPLIAHWPGRFVPAISSDIVDASDFFPTLLELADIDSRQVPKDLDGTSFASILRGKNGPRRETAFFWYDPRPGAGKENLRRSVFAVNKTHKYFRDGRLLRLDDRPLTETLVAEEDWNSADQAAAKMLAEFIESKMNGVTEPPLVDSSGEPVENVIEPIKSMRLHRSV